MTAEEIRSLIARLEAGEIGREIDADIAFLSGRFDYLLSGLDGARIERGQERYDDYVEVLVARIGKLSYNAPYPHFTSSVDAAIAFTKAVLPGCTWGVEQEGASVWNEFAGNIWTPGKPAAALVLAALKAKLLEMEAEHV